MTQISRIRAIRPDGTIVTSTTSSRRTTIPPSTALTPLQETDDRRTSTTVLTPSTPSQPARTQSSSTRTATSRMTETRRSTTTQRTPRTTKSSKRETIDPHQSQRSSSKQTQQIKFDRFRPKAGILSSEDFKCIFCFKLPELPDDKERGIILCPSCKHPAHEDEFKEWINSSNLCSRCSTEISDKYLKHPYVISIETYIKIYEYFLHKRKK